jgi:hypothetical protein
VAAGKGEPRTFKTGIRLPEGLALVARWKKLSRFVACPTTSKKALFPYLGRG